MVVPVSNVPMDSQVQPRLDSRAGGRCDSLAANISWTEGRFVKAVLTDAEKVEGVVRNY